VLRDRNATLVKPLLEIRIGPRFVKPVSRICGSLTNLLGGTFVAFTSGLVGLVAGTWLRNRDAMTVAERLERRVSPAIR